MKLINLPRQLKAPLERIKKDVDYFTDDELIAAKGGELVFDIEIYPNYFLAAFKCPATGKVLTFEQSPDSSLHVSKLMWVLRSFTIIGFNSERFDVPLIWLAVTGVTTDILKEASDKLIKYGFMPRELQQEYKYIVIGSNHVDLINVAPLKASLKTYAGRLHAPRLQDLPFNPETHLTREEAEIVKLYCVNDLDNTALLYNELKPQIKLREQLGEIYEQDLRSKSDAQIAETVIKSELAKVNGHFPKRPTIEPGTMYKYTVPPYIKYSSKIMLETLEKVRNADFIVSEKGSIEMPPELDGLKLRIGNCVYRMGIGGLHSSESCVSYKASEKVYLIDRDVASYYPNILLGLGLCPEQCGTSFLEVYKALVTRRLEAKKAKNMVIADSLKITINGTFGKTANKYSSIYSPLLMVTITLTGQLSLLMLIEMIEAAGINVVSGNTDGIVTKCPKERYNDFEAIIKEWEQRTGFETEETRYKALYCRDVNNYIAIKENDECKVKGVYAEKGSSGNTVLAKNPANLICVDAVKALIIKGAPIEETILNCRDIRRFVTVRNVKGGGFKDDVYLGKVVRWYYAKGELGTINYISSGNKVPRSEGAKPLMDLPGEFPNDIDYVWYIEEANKILNEISYHQTVKQLRFF